MDPKAMGGTDPCSANTNFIIDKLEGAIQSFGGKLEQVVRTSDLHPKTIADWEAPCPATWGAIFRNPPANNHGFKSRNWIGDEILV